MGLVRSIPWKVFSQGTSREVFRKGVKDVVDSKHIMDRYIRREGVVIEGFGTPMTFWKLHTNGDECYCFNDGSPNARHELCNGTGYLNGYQKYGYQTYTFASSSTNITLTNVYVTRDGERLMLTTGTSGTIVTEWITLTNIKEYMFFNHSEHTTSGNSITYEYSFDGTTWTILTDISLLSLTESQIKFRITLTRTSTSIRKPSVDYFKFRFRNRDDLNTANVKFPDVATPAVLASKAAATRVLTGTPQGIVTTMPIRFLALSDMHLEGSDVCMFIKGTYENQRFKAENIYESTYGEDQTLLHIEFDVHFIRDEDDVGGIIYSLS